MPPLPPESFKKKGFRTDDDVAEAQAVALIAKLEDYKPHLQKMSQDLTAAKQKVAERIEREKRELKGFMDDVDVAAKEGRLEVTMGHGTVDAAKGTLTAEQASTQYNKLQDAVMKAHNAVWVEREKFVEQITALESDLTEAVAVLEKGKPAKTKATAYIKHLEAKFSELKKNNFSEIATNGKIQRNWGSTSSGGLSFRGATVSDLLGTEKEHHRETRHLDSTLKEFLTFLGVERNTASSALPEALTQIGLKHGIHLVAHQNDTYGWMVGSDAEFIQECARISPYSCGTQSAIVGWDINPAPLNEVSQLLSKAVENMPARQK